MHIALLTEPNRNISAQHVRRQVEAMRLAGHAVAVWDVTDAAPVWSGCEAVGGGSFPLARARAFLSLIRRPLQALRLSGVLGSALASLPRPHAVLAAGAGVAAVYAAALSRLWKVPFFADIQGADLHRPWEEGLEALCRAERVFAPCEHVRLRADMLMRGSERGPIVMPEGVPEAFFGIERAESRGMTLLFVGRIVRKKGLHVLLDALPGIRQRIPEIQVRVAGDGPLRPDFERFVAENRLAEHVTFLGACDEDALLRELRNARAVCFPCVPCDDGDVDALPLALLEAMAAACPVIASRTGGIAEVIEDFQTGRLVPPGDVAALAEIVPSVLLASSAAKRCAEAARELAREHFRLTETVAEKMVFMEGACAHAPS